MKQRTSALTKSSVLKISLDGRKLKLPAWSSTSLPAIQAYLEGLALQKERVLWALKVDGVKTDLSRIGNGEPERPFSRIEAKSIDFMALGRHLMKVGTQQVVRLQKALGEGVLLVLINEPTAVYHLWQKWQENLREPLVGLRALQELKGRQCLQIFTSEPLSKHLEDLVCINYEVESLFRPENCPDGLVDLITLSEIIEHTVLPWLRRTEEYFHAFNDLVRKSDA
jgi:hypothetical protein